MSSIFQNDTKSVPKSDSQIVRVSMTENEIAGRKDHMPREDKETKLAIEHVGRRGA